MESAFFKKDVVYVDAVLGSVTGFMNPLPLPKST